MLRTERGSCRLPTFTYMTTHMEPHVTHLYSTSHMTCSTWHQVEHSDSIAERYPYQDHRDGHWPWDSWPSAPLSGSSSTRLISECAFLPEAWLHWAFLRLSDSLNLFCVCFCISLWGHLPGTDLDLYQGYTRAFAFMLVSKACLDRAVTQCQHTRFSHVDA